MAEKKNIVMLPIEKLYHHPKNRKDMGDLSELTESIRINGVLQNLVAVSYAPQEHPELSVQDPHDSYVVVIGNRRLEAAKAAGVSELPCEIATMSLKDQIKAMIQENLLRKNPNAREEGEVFQLLIDLGDSVADVSQTTGVSTTTVRNRLKLNLLPKDKLDEAEERGGTMAEYMTAAEFVDFPDLQAMVMDAIGTKDFKNRVSAARTSVKNREIVAKAIEVLETFATKIEEVDYENMIYLRNYAHWSNREVEIPSDASTVKYFYRKGKEQVDLYREEAAPPINEQEEIAFQRLVEKAQKAQAELEEASLRAFEQRMNFVYSITPAKARKHLADIIEFWGRYCFKKEAENPNWSFISISKHDNFSVAEFLGIPKDSVSSNGMSIDLEEWKAATQRTPEYAVLVYLYLAMEDNKLSYRELRYEKVPGTERKNIQVYHYKDNDDLNLIYDFLNALGYQMCDEEVRLKGGSHPMFYREEEYRLDEPTVDTPASPMEPDDADSVA